MEEVPKKTGRTLHIAGIVPIAGKKLDFNMPWHDSMMPIGPDYLAIERAVYECALVGCSTIWIVSHVGIQPLLRKRIGDFLNTDFFPHLSKRADKILYKKANIFYIPIHPKDRDRCDSLGWSVLYGANRAYCLCKAISRWTIPEKFYCAFPYGIGPDETFRESRKLVKAVDTKILFKYDGKSVKDGLYTSFTFTADDYKKARDRVKGYAMSKWSGEGRIPVSLYNETITMSLEQIFFDLDSEGATVVEYPWYFGIDNWKDYSKFIGSGIQMTRNSQFFLTNKKREDI